VSYRVTVRRGPKIERSTHDSLDDALHRMRAEANATPRAGAVGGLGKRYEPRDRVAARIELKAPNAHAGLDVRGDGTVLAWTGRIFKKPLEGDDPYATLRHNVSVGP
jgi:hypothetical protein